MKYLFIILILVSCHNRKVETVGLDLKNDSTLLLDSAYYTIEDLRKLKAGDTVTIEQGYYHMGKLLHPDSNITFYFTQGAHTIYQFDTSKYVKIRSHFWVSKDFTGAIDTQAILRDTFFINHILKEHCNGVSQIGSANGYVLIPSASGPPTWQKKK